MTWVDFKKGSKLTWTNRGSAKFPVTCSSAKKQLAPISNPWQLRSSMCCCPRGPTLSRRDRSSPRYRRLPPSDPPPSSSNTRNHPHPPLRIDNTRLPLREWKQWALRLNNLKWKGYFEHNMRVPMSKRFTKDQRQSSTEDFQEKVGILFTLHK